MRATQVLSLVAIALICGGIAGYGSARLANGGTDQAIVAVEQLQFIDGSGNHRITLELGGDRQPRLVLKDPTGRLLYDLPPSVRVLPAER